MLNKLQQFKKYENKIINVKKDEIKNLFLHKNNLNFTEGVQMLSTKSSIILKASIFKDNIFIQFYKIYNENEKANIYLKIKTFFFKFLKSHIIQGLELLFSKYLQILIKKT